jgi:hypothetical protein
MAKYKPLNENQLVMLPISLQDQLVPGTLEHTISQLVEQHVDLSVFDGRYNTITTRAVQPPSIPRSCSRLSWWRTRRA